VNLYRQRILLHKLPS